MTGALPARIPDVLIPRSLLPQPDRFGGITEHDCQRGDLILQGGRVAGMEPGVGTGPARGMVLPKLTEPHVHLDKCHTVDRLGSVGGDLRAAITAQTEDKARWTAEDLHKRTVRGLGELINAGCGQIRTHVDWTWGADAVKPPPAWSVLAELAEQSDTVLQLALLVRTDDLAVPERAEAIGRIAARNGAALGCFVLDQPARVAGIRAAFQMADKYGLPLDFHVDEGLADGLDGMSIIARTALETGFEGPVLCGHACSLMNLHGDRLNRTIDQIAQAGLFVAALPSTNLYLQGRTHGTPDRRGITRLVEMREAGVNVIMGTDNVRDAFCPLGRHDPRNSLMLAVLGAHLDPPFGQYLPMISTQASRALGLTPPAICGSGVDDLLFFDVSTTSDLLGGQTAPTPLTSQFERARR